MNCKTARDLVSEAMDDRLGQADSRAFRAHVLACQSCRKVFDDLRTLRAATRSLTVEPLASDFKEKLLQRIHSGEGSPPATLRGPVPLAHRVKLFASGAATAAALLLSAWLIVDGLGRDVEEAGAPVGAGSFALAPVELDPPTIAQRTIANSTHLLDKLRREAPTYLGLPPNNARPKIIEPTKDISTGFRLLQAMTPDVVELPPAFRTRLADAESKFARILERDRKPRWSRDDVEEIVRLIQKIELQPDSGSSGLTYKIVVTGEPPDYGVILRRLMSVPQRMPEISASIERLWSRNEASRLGTESRLRIWIGSDGRIHLQLDAR